MDNFCPFTFAASGLPQGSMFEKLQTEKRVLHCKVVISGFLGKVFDDPSPGPRRLVKTPAAVHPPPQGGEGNSPNHFGCGRKAALRYYSKGSKVESQRLNSQNSHTYPAL
jgi:hypothetical protein